MVSNDSGLPEVKQPQIGNDQMTDQNKTPQIQDICDKLGELFKELNISATVIVKHPELDETFTFYNCHFYDAAVMLSKAYTNIRSKINEELL